MRPYPACDMTHDPDPSIARAPGHRDPWPTTGGFAWARTWRRWIEALRRQIVKLQLGPVEGPPCI